MPSAVMSDASAPATQLPALDAGVAAAADASAASDEDAGPFDAAVRDLPAAGDAAQTEAASVGGAPVTPVMQVMQGENGATCAPDLNAQQKPERLGLSGALQLSDPALIESREAQGTYYVFATGPGISVRASTDLRTWQDAGRVFAFDPPWIALTLDSESELWSPDVSFFGGVYHLYYAVSKQGNNRSCIGHATARTLPGPFEDQGAVLCSSLGAQRDDWNAIHPNYIEDENGQPYLAFGSFYSGIKLVALDPSTGKVAQDELISIAARKQQGGAVEAPFIVRRCGYFYLFVSFDRCCDGVNSTYKIYVGRSKSLAGPYLDRDGAKLLDGAGTPLVVGDNTWHGPGHSAVLRSGDRWFEAHHAYYAGDPSFTYQEGQSYLRISELKWDAMGWPASGGP